MSKFTLRKLEVKPTAEPVVPERLIGRENCVNCGHLYCEHLVGMNTVQTGECEHCRCYHPECADEDALWDEVDTLKAELADAIGRAEKAERIAKELGVSEQRFRIAVENFLAWFGSRAEWERENRNAKPVTRQDVIAMRDALRASDYVAEDARAKMEELND